MTYKVIIFTSQIRFTSFSFALLCEFQKRVQQKSLNVNYYISVLSKIMLVNEESIKLIKRRIKICRQNYHVFTRIKLKNPLIMIFFLLKNDYMHLIFFC